MFKVILIKHVISMDETILKHIQINKKIKELVFNYLDSYKGMGHVYCFDHKIFKIYGKNVYKIGKAINVERRKGDYNAILLEDFDVMHKSRKLNYYALAEAMVFNKLRKYRIRSDRELFNCEISLIKRSIINVVKLLCKFDKNKDKLDNTDIKNFIKDNSNLLCYVLIKYHNFGDIFSNMSGVMVDGNCPNWLDKMFLFYKKNMDSKKRKVFTNNTLRRLKIVDKQKNRHIIDTTSFIEQFNKQKDIILNKIKICDKTLCSLMFQSIEVDNKRVYKNNIWIFKFDNK